MTMGERIKARRRQLRMTQRQLAQACGWGDAQGRVGNYERGDRGRLADADVRALALALQCTPEYLQWGSETPELTGEEWHLVQLYRSLGVAERRSLHFTMQRVADAPRAAYGNSADRACADWELFIGGLPAARYDDDAKRALQRRRRGDEGADLALLKRFEPYQAPPAGLAAHRAAHLVRHQRAEAVARAQRHDHMPCVRRRSRPHWPVRGEP